MGIFLFFGEEEKLTDFYLHRHQEDKGGQKPFKLRRIFFGESTTDFFFSIGVIKFQSGGGKREKKVFFDLLFTASRFFSLSQENINKRKRRRSRDGKKVFLAISRAIFRRGREINGKKNCFLLFKDSKSFCSFGNNFVPASVKLDTNFFPVTPIYALFLRTWRSRIGLVILSLNLNMSSSQQVFF